MRYSLPVFNFLVLIFLSDNLSPLSADEVLFDNGVGGAAGISSGQTSDYDPRPDGYVQIMADDFSIPRNTVIRSVRWTGAYSPGNTPPDTDNFEVAFYRQIISPSGFSFPDVDAGPLLVFDIDTTRVDSGVDVGTGFDIFEYSATFDTPIALNDRTFFLSLRNDTTDDKDDNWAWAGRHESELEDGSSAIINIGQKDQIFGLNHLRTDFQLLGTTIPEPSSTIIGAFVLFCLCGRRR